MLTRVSLNANRIITVNAIWLSYRPFAITTLATALDSNWTSPNRSLAVGLPTVLGLSAKMADNSRRA